MYQTLWKLKKSKKFTKQIRHIVQTIFTMFIFKKSNWKTFLKVQLKLKRVKNQQNIKLCANWGWHFIRWHSENWGWHFNRWQSANSGWHLNLWYSANLGWHFNRWHSANSGWYLPPPLEWSFLPGLQLPRTGRSLKTVFGPPNNPCRPYPPTL